MAHIERPPLLQCAICTFPCATLDIRFGNDHYLGQAGNNFIAFHSATYHPWSIGVKLAHQKDISRFNFGDEVSHLDATKFMDAVRQYNSSMAIISTGSALKGSPINATGVATDNISTLFCQKLCYLSSKCQA